MRAIVRDTYGGPEVLSLGEVDRPEPRADEVRISVRASSLNSADVRMLRGDPSIAKLAFGVRRPRQRVLGRDVAGVVESVGASVTRLAPGDRVCCEADGGAWAELVTVPERFVGLVPDGVGDEFAATLPLAGGTAVQAVHDAARVQAGQQVLVTGASGNVGLFAVRLAAASGAIVTAVGAPTKAELLRQAGAAHTLGSGDDIDGAARFDAVIDISGRDGWRALRSAVAPKGSLVLVSGTGGRVLGPLPNLASATFARAFVSQRIVPVTAVRRRDDLDRLTAMAADGTLEPQIDRVVPLAELPDAVRRLEAREARGKLVIAI